MADKITNTPVYFWMCRRLTVLAACIMVTVLIACSDAPPADTPVPTAPPAETAVPATPTLEPSPTPVPATVVPTPIVRAGSFPPASTIGATAVTAAPFPTATAEPPQPTVAPFVSEAHRAASERVFTLVEELSEELGHREVGTPEELRAAENLKERLDAMGYSAEIQSFSFEFFDIALYMQTRGANAKVVIKSPMQAEFPGLPLTTTPAGGMDFGSLVLVGQGRTEDLPAGGLEGKVVLIQPGDVALDDSQALRTLLAKVGNAAEAGAMGAVISGNIMGLNRFVPLIAAESTIPALVLPVAAMGEQLSAMADAGEVSLSVSIETEVMQSQNVVAELKGRGEGLVIVGGHYDVVPQTKAGANDNTSGVAVVLSLAEALAGRTLPFSVMFMAFGAEEVGLFGSGHYVSSLGEEELGSIKAMLNFDVVGTGPSIAVVGDEPLTVLALETAASLGINAERGMLPSGASSDHQSFQQVGVPVLVIWATDPSRIHTPQDRLEFVQPERLGDSFLVAQELLQSLEFGQ